MDKSLNSADGADGEVDAFDHQAALYDAWYDSPEGRAAFRQETDALRPFLEGLPRPFLEVGVGGGRFAAAFGVEFGIDPAFGALRLAANRGVRVAVAQGEAMPFPDASFGAVLLVTSLCFVADATLALREARRVVRPDGKVLLGLMPAEGPLGQRYREMAQQGDPYFKRARFFRRGELASLFEASGLRQSRVRSTLFESGEGEAAVELVCEEDDLSAGFIATLLDPVSR